MAGQARRILTVSGSSGELVTQPRLELIRLASFREITHALSRLHPEVQLNLKATSDGQPISRVMVSFDLLVRAKTAMSLHILTCRN